MLDERLFAGFDLFWLNTQPEYGLDNRFLLNIINNYSIEINEIQTNANILIEQSQTINAKQD